MNQNKLKVILGGTFDPIHYGHLRLAENLHNLIPKAQITFMPSATPPHRETPSVSARQRSEMLELAIKGIEHFNLDTRELQRQGESYSLLSVNEIKKENPDTRIIWIMGDDAYAKLHTWFGWQELVEKVSFVVVARPGALQSEPAKAVVNTLSQCCSIEELLTFSSGAVFRHICPLLEISASNIRELLMRNLSCRFLLPESVLNYIKQNDLYSHKG
ncbi:nicotinate-nucleotide adenylyltransferase [Pleionea sediminis]|uniref:nicotinate-nucleotide adenylyltransferase n=1 Tax=Pleionea sediminis TaxID=2569479 RepID=UPI001186BE4A|nr:nicotinate-nucleotide adenylyltransferase [Pleionea sediminis]